MEYKSISYHVRPISRGKGKSAIGTAAYISREKLYNRYDGRTYDFTKKQDLVYKQILLPVHAPKDFHDRSTLWNAVEQIEKSSIARLAREAIIALPIELNRNEQIKLITSYAQETFVSKGMCADIAIHDKGEGNPHAHIMLTTRSIDENGNWLAKQRKNYILDEDGNKIYDPIKKQYKCGQSIKTNDWDAQGKVTLWRQLWAESCNALFMAKNLEMRVTHESYAMRGIKREPTKHYGPAVMALKKRGIETDRSNEIAAIEIRNKEFEERELKRRLKREQKRSRGLSLSRS